MQWQDNGNYRFHVFDKKKNKKKTNYLVDERMVQWLLCDKKYVIFHYQ